ncbi:uncharacterized protein LOC130968350 [Arachis stenosperma]|uniref:uncharacterized protein LOC130968350 n=1 Tax=Arachis stenosperma TaxID=217475 RepID=UPI0025AC880D|nr:uncharacterized protein LOC130968350 [Arachis stenosperma]XP_057749548.1 uncharacterized protein LOC130968350 [Arachis stenosperma]
MFSFSCFHAHVSVNKPKKTVPPYTEEMMMALKGGPRSKVSKGSSVPRKSNPKAEQEHMQLSDNETSSNWDPVERTCKSEDLNSEFSFEIDGDVLQTMGLKKSHSLETGLYLTNTLTESDTHVGFPWIDSTRSQNESPRSICRKEHDPSDQRNKNPESEYQFSSGLVSPSDRDACDHSDTPLSSELAGDYTDRSGPGTPYLKKSRSLPNVRASKDYSGEDTFKHHSSKSRSSNDLHALDMGQKECRDEERENEFRRDNEIHMESYLDDGLDSSPLSDSAKDWVMPVMDDASEIKPLQRASSDDCFLSEFTNADFKIKRIEDWVIGLEDCEPPLDETNEVPKPVDSLVESNITIGVTAAGTDQRATPGMEAAKRYISTLGANASAAQLVNHGLVVIPFLSAFVSLKVLNLSGNAIVRITAGALPRGLHVLNLSRNNISTIEGLRELTRLRVLDLSYNRILRIGHGLASCSSLKELYLAGNKISEVEGLHRLLKLTILDLRFNKISTAKCLGQLAANYNSLQAISLEGNPSQKNVGDEQLKKYLQGLLPHLVYYNRQPLKASSLKDGTDRSVRLGISSHQSERSLRTDRKTSRKGSHGTVASRKPSASSSHSRRSQGVETPKLSKSRQAYPPSIKTKASAQSRNHFDVPSTSTVPNLGGLP